MGRFQVHPVPDSITLATLLTFGGAVGLVRFVDVGFIQTGKYSDIVFYDIGTGGSDIELHFDILGFDCLVKHLMSFGR